MNRLQGLIFALKQARADLTLSSATSRGDRVLAKCLGGTVHGVPYTYIELVAHDGAASRRPWREGVNAEAGANSGALPHSPLGGG